jgi:hypothetical protein
MSGVEEDDMQELSNGYQYIPVVAMRVVQLAFQVCAG